MRAARTSLPWILRRLVELGEIDGPTAAMLAAHDILTIGDLRSALDGGRVVQHLPDSDARLRQAIEALTPERVLVPLGRAVDLLEGLVELLASACPELAHLTPAGDVRRYEPLVEWLAVAGASREPSGAFGRIYTMRDVHPVLHTGQGRALVTYGGVEVDVRIAAPETFGTVLHESTGSRAHVAAVRTRRRADPASATEEDEYRRAGLPWIPPELRHDTGEIEAARSGTLPRLIERAHIRGDLHIHTDYSDGRDPVLAMVRESAALGYQYIAITDHSARSFASRTLTLDSLARQRDEIAEARARFPELVILHGVEVDIMPDGRLDFPDHVLERLDIVLASLHDRASHDEARLTRRCLAAIRHPLVNVITHPANRLVGRDAGYDLDFEAIFDAAAETGTALEIDGAPGHLDMDGALARRAVAAGATVVIDSDCHRASLLDRQMRLGVGTARRGWVEPPHVLNARPFEEVKKFLAAKRAGRHRCL